METKMLLIPTYLAESEIPNAGLGIFCKEFVSQSTVIWKFHLGFDYIIDRLPDDVVMRAFVMKYGYQPIDGKDHWIMCADDARFFNHSENPSCLDTGDVTSARFDLVPGTELTSDYRVFCRDPFVGFRA